MGAGGGPGPSSKIVWALEKIFSLEKEGEMSPFPPCTFDSSGIWFTFTKDLAPVL